MQLCWALCSSLRMHFPSSSRRFIIQCWSRRLSKPFSSGNKSANCCGVSFEQTAADINSEILISFFLKKILHQSKRSKSVLNESISLKCDKIYLITMPQENVLGDYWLAGLHQVTLLCAWPGGERNVSTKFWDKVLNTITFLMGGRSDPCSKLFKRPFCLRKLLVFTT